MNNFNKIIFIIAILLQPACALTYNQTATDHIYKAFDELHKDGLTEKSKTETIEKIKNAIIAGANPNISFYDGERHLFQQAARSWKNYELLEILLNHGADIDALDNTKDVFFRQHTSLMWAVFDHDIKLVRFLLTKGADRNKRDYFGCTAYNIGLARLRSAESEEDRDQYQVILALLLDETICPANIHSL